MILGCFRRTDCASHSRQYYWRSMTLLHVMLCIFGTLSLATDGVETTTPPLDIYWNKTNSIFSRSNNDHILEVQIRERIRFLCPFYDSTEPQAEHYIIYRLPKQFYDACYLPSDATERELRSQYGIEKVHNCSSPYNQSSFTSYVDTFVPLPGSYGGMVYEYGKEYYFTSISTGTSSGIHNRRSSTSACKNYNMKAIVRVCCNETFTDPPIVTGQPNAVTTTVPATAPTEAVTASTKQPTVSWSTIKSQVTKNQEKDTTTASAGHTDPVVGEGSSATAVNGSLLTLALCLIFIRLSQELT